MVKTLLLNFKKFDPNKAFSLYVINNFKFVVNNEKIGCIYLGTSYCSIASDITNSFFIFDVLINKSVSLIVKLE